MLVKMGVHIASGATESSTLFTRTLIRTLEGADHDERTINGMLKSHKMVSSIRLLAARFSWLANILIQAIINSI